MNGPNNDNHTSPKRLLELNYESVGYEQLLQQVSTFMEQSGIRQFCRTKCRGACCYFTRTGKCNPVKQDCEQHPRLACNLWICYSLFSILIYLAQERDQKLVTQFLSYYMYQFKVTAIKRLQDLLAVYANCYQEADCYLQHTPQAVKDHFKLAPIPDLANPEILQNISSMMELLGQIVERQDSRFGSYLDLKLIHLIRSEAPIDVETLHLNFPELSRPWNLPASP